MALRCGIVGLPNVGKSTIFNALTRSSVDAQNYPFCTIEPNTGVVQVPDVRLEVLAGISQTQKVVPTVVEFVDIAGLVKGASKGEGLGNQFLGHIRQVDAIVHVLRCFDDEDIVHVYDDVSPKRDIEIIELELQLADLATVERRIERIRRSAKGCSETKLELKELENLKEHLENSLSVASFIELRGDDLHESVLSLQLLGAKPVLYLANLSEGDLVLSQTSDRDLEYLSEVIAHVEQNGGDYMAISGRVEEEISTLEPEEAELFLKDMSLEESGLDRLAKKGYALLELSSFFTTGEKETRAWTIKRGATAIDAAAVIHTDFAKGFIRAEVISYGDFVSCNGEKGAREKGLLRLEGKDYIVHDGDVMHFRFNL